MYRRLSQSNRLSKLSYWKNRAHLSKTLFKLSKFSYRLNEYKRDRQTDASILLVLTKSTLIPFLFSIIVLIIIIVSPLDNVSNTNVDKYDNLIIAVASIAGIFISLYFTSLNTVLGNLYAKSPTPVRDLLIQERVNHFSVRFLVFLTILCLEIIGMGILLDKRPILIVYVIVILGCFGVLFFAELGKRAFYFFDPSVFVSQLHSEIIKWANECTPKGHRFLSSEFQLFYRSKCEQALKGFQGIIHLSKSESHLNETIIKIVAKLQSVYIEYLWIKRKIPTKSRWFQYSPKFQEWFTSSEILVRLASQTQTSLRPENKPNHYWLEEIIEDIEIESSKFTIENKKWDAFQSILMGVFNQFTSLGASGEIDHALSFFGYLDNSLLTNYIEPIQVPVDWDEESLKYKFGVIQGINSLLITLTAGLSNALEKTNITELAIKISNLDWRKKITPYDLDLPFRILSRTEFIQDALLFERNSEGDIVSPNWYLTELVFQDLSFYLEEITNLIFDKCLNIFKKRIEFYEKEKRFVETNLTASDALEMESKARRLLFIAKSLSQEFENYRSIEKLPWAEWKWDYYKEQLDDFHEKMIIVLVSNISPLFTWKRVTNFPDYFGKSIIFAGEECIKSLETNNGALFAKLFQQYFSGILVSFEKMRLNSADLRPQQLLLLIAEPIMDLFHICGYSLLYSEFHQNPSLFEPCKSIWIDTITSSEIEYIELLALIVKNKKQSFSITNRDSSRSQWNMDFNKYLQSLPRKIINTQSVIGGISILDHPSDLIKKIGRRGNFPMSIYQPDDVFLDIFLSKIPKIEGVDFGLKHKISEYLD